MGGKQANETKQKFPFSPLIRSVPKPKVVGTEAGRVVPSTEGRTGRKLLLHALLRRGPVWSNCAVGGKCDSLASQSRRAFIEELFTARSCCYCSVTSLQLQGRVSTLVRCTPSVYLHSFITSPDALRVLLGLFKNRTGIWLTLYGVVPLQIAITDTSINVGAGNETDRASKRQY